MRRSRAWCIGATIFGGVFSLIPLSAIAQKHDERAIMRGVVVASQSVKAYARALGASTDEWGRISCKLSPGIVRIKRSTIYRIKTTRSYYDLSKVCGMRGDFRWPRHYIAKLYASPDYDTWNRYERLKVGDRVWLRTATTKVRLTDPRCLRLGLLPKSVYDATQDLMDDLKRFKATAEADHLCTYKVPIMHVRIKWSSTEVAGPGAHGTDTYDKTWDFRIVGSGPIALTKIAPVGKGYLPSLLPAW